VPNSVFMLTPNKYIIKTMYFNYLQISACDFHLYSHVLAAESTAKIIPKCIPPG
jgi:hypothetical protein